MDSIKKIFLRGLFTLLPVAVTIYILFAGVSIFENMLGSFLRIFIPQTAYIPGLGFLLSLILIFLFGLMLNSFIATSFLGSLEKRLLSVPLIKAVYSPLKDIMNLFSKHATQPVMIPVFVELSPGINALGLITRDWFEDLPTIKDELNNFVTVYIPMSYGLGGFTLVIEKSKLRKANIPAEKALSLAITGWVKAHADEDHLVRKKPDALEH